MCARASVYVRVCVRARTCAAMSTKALGWGSSGPPSPAAPHVLGPGPPVTWDLDRLLASVQSLGPALTLQQRAALSLVQAQRAWPFKSRKRGSSPLLSRPMGTFRRGSSVWKDDRCGVTHPIPHLQGPRFGGQGSGDHPAPADGSPLTRSREMHEAPTARPAGLPPAPRRLYGAPPPAASVPGQLCGRETGDGVAVGALRTEPPSWWAGRPQGPQGKSRALSTEQSDATSMQASPMSPGLQVSRQSSPRHA